MKKKNQSAWKNGVPISLRDSAANVTNAPPHSPLWKIANEALKSRDHLPPTTMLAARECQS